jgi:DNA-binding NtrC family response regulator
MSTQLREQEIKFFELVNQAALANPFDDERVHIDLKIAGLPPDITTAERIRQISAAVRERLQRLEKRWGRPPLMADFAGKERELIRSAFIFDFFHYFLDAFDQLIVDQKEAGDIPIKVIFAQDALRLLAKRGFSPKASCRFLALCYQLRRAYYFIEQSLIGRSRAMKVFRRSLWNNVFTANLTIYDRYLWNRMEDFSTLLLGETGTGKGTAAKAIGRSGFIPFDAKRCCFVRSFSGSLVALNLSQFQEALIESELFGHKKGAFTGANADHQGVFDLCSPHGSIFLDEIGEVSVPVQIKLLRVLEERVFYPVGSYTARRFAGRIIAATNRPFETLYPNGVLRSDFFYRLCSDIIVVPPLRQRIKEDPQELDDLLAYTVARILGEPCRPLFLMVKSVIAEQLGKAYRWPGNVRELAQCVRRILLNHHYQPPALQAGHLQGGQLAEEMAAGTVDAQTLVQKYCAMLYEHYGTYTEVARRTRLDRRTVKKHIEHQTRERD